MLFQQHFYETKFGIKLEYCLNCNIKAVTGKTTNGKMEVYIILIDVNYVRRPSDEEDPDTWLLDSPTRRLLQSVNDELAARIGCAPGCTVTVSVRGGPPHLMTSAEVSQERRIRGCCLMSRGTWFCHTTGQESFTSGSVCASSNASPKELSLKQRTLLTAAIESIESRLVPGRLLESVGR